MTKVDEKIEILYKLYKIQNRWILFYLLLFSGWILEIVRTLKLQIISFCWNIIWQKIAINPGKIILNNKIKYKE